MQGSRAEAEERQDRTWVIVWLSPTRLDLHPEPALDAASAPISQVNDAEQEWQSGAAQNRGRRPQLVGAANLSPKTLQLYKGLVRLHLMPALGSHATSRGR
jgi:hypothetical protein